MSNTLNLRTLQPNHSTFSKSTTTQMDYRASLNDRFKTVYAVLSAKGVTKAQISQIWFGHRKNHHIVTMCLEDKRQITYEQSYKLAKYYPEDINLVEFLVGVQENEVDQLRQEIYNLRASNSNLEQIIADIRSKVC